MTRTESNGSLRGTLALALILLVAALFGACADPAPAKFPHQPHLTQPACGVPGKPECLSCNDCHTVSAKDRAHKLPELARCEGCHRDNAHEMRAVLSAPPSGTPGIIFDHQQHLKMKELRGQCIPCHGGVVEAGKASIPPMSQCFSCHHHEKQWQAAVCTPCHEQAQLSQTFPETFLKHDEDFAVRHGMISVQEKKLCQSCHTEAQCNACHDVTQNLTVARRQPENIERTQVHRGNFLTHHAIEAQNASARCMTCHTQQSCDSCHVARGVSGNAQNGRNPHPAGWVSGNTASRNFHGQAARRDIVLCASCHDQGPATNCIRCHKVGAYGGNPHPSGWRSTRSEGSQMCRYCHG